MTTFFPVAHPCKIPNACQHLCIPTWNKDIAVKKCLCANGYHLNEKNECVMKFLPKFLLLAQGKPSVIKGFNLQNTSEEIFSVAGVNQPFSVDYDLQTNSVIYIDSARKIIESASLNNTKDRKTLLHPVYSDGIAVDWIGHNLYYIENIWRSVNVLNLDSITQVKTVLGNLNMRPRYLALNPEQGSLYLAVWSDMSPITGRIDFAYMDGTNYKTLVSENIHWPVGLCIDYENERLYWSDQHKHTVESVDFEGGTRQTVIHKELGQPSGLAIGSGRIFVINSIENVVKVYNKDVSTGILNNTGATIFDVKVYDPKLRKGEFIIYCNIHYNIQISF